MITKQWAVKNALKNGESLSNSVENQCLPRFLVSGKVISKSESWPFLFLILGDTAWFSRGQTLKRKLYVHPITVQRNLKLVFSPFNL